MNLLGHQRKIFNATQQLKAYLSQGQVEVWHAPTVQPAPWISALFPILCLLCLVSFILVEHIFGQNKKEYQLLYVRKSIKCHSVYSSTLHPTLQPEVVKKRIGLSDRHSRQMTEERCTMGTAVQVKVGLRSFWGEGGLWRFLNVFHSNSLYCCLPSSLLTHLQSYLSHLLLNYCSSMKPSIFPSSLNTKEYWNVFVSILMEISPHKELRKDNQSLFLIFLVLFVKLYHFPSP